MDTPFVIERDIPVPTVPVRRTRRSYPWRDLNIGDSFYVACRDGETPGDLQTNLGATSVGAAKRLGTRYTVRLDGDGVRIWRIA